MKIRRFKQIRLRNRVKKRVNIKQKSCRNLKLRKV